MAASLTRPYAGKSGSTPYDYWMAGFTPALASVVWTGYDDGSEITKTEDRSRAKVIWSAFMEKVHMGQQPQEFKWPRGLIEVEVDVETGTACTGGHKLLFERGTEPTEECQPEADPAEDQLFPELPEWFR